MGEFRSALLSLLRAILVLIGCLGMLIVFQFLIAFAAAYGLIAPG